MSRAEEAALKAYHTNIPAAIRIAYRDGYEQAEKDCALTWKDVQAIFRIADNYESELNRPKYLTQEYCEEVLRRFNKNKE